MAKYIRMPVRQSLNTSLDVPANASLQYDFSKQETTSSDSSLNGNSDFDLASFRHPFRTPFPSLTGLRSRATAVQTESVTITSKVTSGHVRDATAAFGASPITALQAAWAVILSIYTAAQDDVVYTTLITSPAGHKSGDSSEDIFHRIPTRVSLNTRQKCSQPTSGTILRHLTEANALALCQPKQSEVSAAHDEELDKHGTIIALKTKECPEGDDDTFKWSKELFKGDEIAVGIVAWPNLDGFLMLKVVYIDQVLNEAGALVMLEQLDDILAFVLANTAKPIANSLAAVRCSLLSTSNERPEEPTEDDLATTYLHTQFETFVKHSPHRVALDFRKDIGSKKPIEDTTWTYEQLNDRADTFAKYLLCRFGQLTDDVIPVCMERRPELYVAILGILKSGGAWCPIDASFPARRRHDLIARTRSRMLIIAEQKPGGSADGIPRGVVLVNIACLGNTVADQIETRTPKMGSLAYLIWTSGTTGDPKGVPIHHEAAVTSMRALQRSIPVDVSSGTVRCIQFSHFTFDVFVQDLFYTWGVGGTVIASTREIMLGSFAELATETKATHAHLTPAFAASVRRERCPTLEVITMIGERLPQVVADDWSRDMRAFNTYGPAEATVVSTLRRFGAVGDQTQSENIGFPLVSVSAFVMRDDRPLMRHGIGELALGGPQLAQGGYWNDPERSSGRFLWNEQCSRHLYMTGDCVRQIHDGSLEFIGRTDDLIKIQGIRIELSEIAFSLRSCHPLVEQVEIQYMNRQDRPSKVIVAFLAAPRVDHSNQPLSSLYANEKSIQIAQSALLEAQQNLPSYMIPMVFLVVNRIPQTSSAKTDRAALKAMYGSVDLEMWERMLASNGKSTSVKAIWSTHESDLIAIIAEISGTSRGSMSRASDLRSIGIDSIAATRLAPLLNGKGYPLSVADILQCENLDDLSKMTDKSRTMHTTARFDLEAFHNEWFARVEKEIKRSDCFVAPALPLQESLLSESMRNASAYWSHVFFSLTPQVDNTRLYEAWMQVVSDTEALRTGFIPSAAVADHRDDAFIQNSTFLQLIYQKATIDWTCVKTSKAGMKDLATQRAHAVAESHRKNHFRDPLLAITIFEQPSNDIMMISIHHSVRDDASLDYILEDVCKSYQEVRAGSDQRHQLREALQVMIPAKHQLDQDEQFWSKALENFIVTDDANTWPDLTGKNTRSDGSAAAFITHTSTLKTSYKDLQSAAPSLGASSVASILRVAWGIVLLEYLETDRAVFAETWSKRSDDYTLTDVVGPLMNVLPVPFRPLGSARETLVAQSNFHKETRAHRLIQSRIIRKLLGQSEGQALYPAVFNFLPDMREDSLNGYSSIWHQIEDIVGLTVEHPLALNIAQTVDGALEMEISASQTVMSSAHIAILALQVDAFVGTILRFPDLPITQLSSYFPQSLLSMTSVSFSEEVKLAWKQNPTDWVDHYATVHPNWPAAQVVTSLQIQCEFETWSFAELHSAYNRVSKFISHSGYSNRMIAVCVDRRLEAYAIVLGILASGNIYLPIDEDLPAERKSFLLEDSTAVILFTTRFLALRFPKASLKSRVVYVDDSTYIKQTNDGHLPEAHSHSKPSDNAYLLYTSGSTGVPKGVLVGRGNLCSFIEGLSEFICPLIPGMKGLPGKGKYLGLASRAFDVHIAEMFLAWRQGLAAVTASRTMLLDNLELALRKLNITHTSFVPSLIDQAGLDPANLPDLHYLGVGGEKMSKSVIDTWASNENAALVNAYGPTEMSIGCTATEVTRESTLRNVGRPYGNSVAHVLVPGSNFYTLRGVAGELCFTGDLVANGYHNRPNAKGFVDDFNGARMYRTGDIVRLMADDTLEYLRREDDQTKVRGQRLELGEITEAIRSTAVTTLGLIHIDVATIVAQHPKLARPQLVSFFVPHPLANKDTESSKALSSASDYTIAGKIQAGCRKVLPSYMVPDVVIPLTKLPLAPASGKADMKCLKALFADIPIADMMHQASSEQPNHPESSHRELTEAESNVRSVVMNTLAVDATETTTNTNIFLLGLDSLSAISLAIRMQRLGYDCTVSSVLRNPLIEQLALLPRTDQTTGVPADGFAQTRSKLADLASRFRASHSHGLVDSSIQCVRPCLPLQETLVATSLNNKSGALYMNHVTLRLSTDIDPARLYRAWARVVADHDILRTCFQEFENGIVQIVTKYHESQSISWEEVATPDPESASQLKQSTSATDIISNIASKAPIRLTLFQPPSDDMSSILLISLHHALYDRVSIAIVFQELAMRYHSAIPPAYTPFDTMIEHVCSQDQEAAKTFWRQYLADYRPTSTMDRADDTNGNLNNVFLTTERTFASPLAEIEDFSSSISGTLTSTIQAVFGIVLAKTLEVPDVVFGVILSGRTVPIEKPHTIVGPCITTVPQRVDFRTGSSTILDVVKGAQQGFVASLEFQHTALRQIHRWLGAEQPLFDCLVSYVQKIDSEPSPYPQLWTELDDSMPNDFPFSIEFEADPGAGRMRAHCFFSPAFGDTDRAASLLEDIDLLLGALIRGENITPKDLNISESEVLESRSKPQVWDESHWTPRELEMRALAAEICSTSAEDISKGASFFSLGIDSITAIQFAQHLRRSGMECSSADVMRHSCIAALARKIGTLPPNINSTEGLAQRPQEDSLEQMIPKIPILGPADAVTDVYACTPLQSSMLTQTLGSDGKLYSYHHAVQLAGHINITTLKQAWRCLTERTEILRTTFHLFSAYNSWLAAVHHKSPDTWTEREIGISTSEMLTDIAHQSIFQEEADFQCPPWKTTILKTASNVVLVISMHHSLYDGQSINLLLQDLARLYEGIDLPLREPFSNAARAVSKSRTDAEEFWLRKLDGFENSEDSLSQKSPMADMIGIEVTFKLDIESTLRGCKDLGVTVQTVALLAYGKSLACISGRRDVVFGHVVGGRSLAMPGADEVVGPLFNTVPSRVTFDKTYVTNQAAAVEIQQSSGDSQPHQHASLGRVQQGWRQKIGDADAQLFDTLFVFQNSKHGISSTDGLWTSLDIGGAIGHTEYSTNFEFEQRKEEIMLRLASRKGLRTQEQLQVWLTDYEQAFQDILEHPRRSVMAFPGSLQSLPLAIGSDESRPSPQDEIAPGSDLECIRIALSEVSGIPPENIPVNASIFSLGLDSISAIQVAARCRKQGHGVSVADVLQGRSLGGICRRLRDRNPEQDSQTKNQVTLISAESRSKAVVLANLKDEDIEDVLPCLAGQLYHLATWLKSRRTTCEAVWTYRCSKNLNVDDLRSAWRGLRERHSVLRTIFVALSPKETIQVVLKGSALNHDSFKCIEALGGSIGGSLDLIERETKQPFDLFSPPSKLYFVRGASEDYVVLKLHHATYDAWTIQTLVEDLAALYRGTNLPTLPRFDSFIHHTMHSLHTEREEVYWRKSLKQCQQTLLQPSITPPDPAVPTPTNTPSTFVSIKPAIANLQSLETTARESSISLPTIILLAFARALARHTSVENPTFGLYQAGRSASFKSIDQLCAPCLNITPVVIPDALAQPALTSAQALQLDLAERVDFEQSYLPEVLEWAGCGGEPLFNTFVNILSHERGARGPPAPSPSFSSSSSSSSTTQPTTSNPNPFFIPHPLRTIPTNTTPAEPTTHSPTAVDALEVGYLAEQNLYLDVVRDVEDDCVVFALKCDGELMDEGVVRAFADEVGGEVEGIVRGLGRDGVGKLERGGEEDVLGGVDGGGC